jgi:hypothetical protein
MLSKGLLVSVVAFVLVAVLLVGCQKSPTGGAVITQSNENAPKDVVVTSQPAPQQPVQPAAQPAQAVPVNRIPTNVLPQPDMPQIIVIPENKPVADPVQACIDKCDSDCKISATFSCSKPSGAECRMACGGIIDPSACSTACSLKNARSCEPKFIEFCTAQCVGRCH